MILRRCIVYSLRLCVVKQKRDVAAPIASIISVRNQQIADVALRRFAGVSGRFHGHLPPRFGGLISLSLSFPSALPRSPPLSLCYFLQAANFITDTDGRQALADLSKSFPRESRRAAPDLRILPLHVSERRGGTIIGMKIPQQVRNLIAVCFTSRLLHSRS